MMSFTLCFESIIDLKSLARELWSGLQRVRLPQGFDDVFHPYPGLFSRPEMMANFTMTSPAVFTCVIEKFRELLVFSGLTANELISLKGDEESLKRSINKTLVFRTDAPTISQNSADIIHSATEITVRWIMKQRSNQSERNPPHTERADLKRGRAPSPTPSTSSVRSSSSSSRHDTPKSRRIEDSSSDRRRSEDHSKDRRGSTESRRSSVSDSRSRDDRSRDRRDASEDRRGR